MMASVWKDTRNGTYLIKFHYGGQCYTRSCQTEKENEAHRLKALVDETLSLLNTGRQVMPEGVTDPGVWIMSGGKLDKKPIVEAPCYTLLNEVCDAYLASQLDKADTTLESERLHIRHLKRLLGERARLGDLTLDTLQAYVGARVKEKAKQDRLVSGSTVKKELTTFMQVWDWARQRGIVKKICHFKDPNNPRKWAVNLPKPDEAGKFMTWAEIERRISRGGLTAQERKDLWKYLFLDERQVAALLAHVREHAQHPFIYPMFVMAACTGARRNEICRSWIDDFKFDDNVVTVRERKRRKDMASTTRDVPMRTKLRDTMQDWFARHPGGKSTITPPLSVPRRKPKVAFDELTREEAHHHFKQTLVGSRWEVVRGFHVLRHSFGAICTRAGIPMNMIARWMGHTTEEMMKLYQHLFPQDEQQWMDKFPV
jgi:integrase